MTQDKPRGTDAEILRYWRMGQYDTTHIADLTGATEAEVYRVVSNRARPKPVEIRQSAKIPYMPVKAKKPRTPRQPVVVPIKRPEPGCQYRLREGALYLHESGEAKTSDIRHAWKGDAVKALACCERDPIAKNMQMEIII